MDRVLVQLLCIWTKINVFILPMTCFIYFEESQLKKKVYINKVHKGGLSNLSPSCHLE